MARRWHPASCKVDGCTARRADGVHISARGLCPEHGDAHQLENTAQLRAHRGPRFEHWRRRIVASAGGKMPEPATSTADAA